LHRTVPAAIRLEKTVGVCQIGLSEYQYQQDLPRSVAAKKPSVQDLYLGLGYSNTIRSGRGERNILEIQAGTLLKTLTSRDFRRSAWKLLLNFQTMIMA